MIGRDIELTLNSNNKSIISDEIVNDLKKSDFVIGNLEGPIGFVTNENHQNFSFSKKMLNKVNFIDFFSLANNHINDNDDKGLKDTLKFLHKNKIKSNGVFYEKYEPYKIQNENNKIAIFCCTEFSNNNPKKEDPSIFFLKDLLSNNLIERSKKNNFFNICFVHGGIMFTQLPNPIFRKDMHKLIDKGADLIITVHPHVIGSEEIYNEKFIIYSLGDFLMDGKSYDRRRSLYINLEINQNKIDLIEYKVTKNVNYFISLNEKQKEILKKRKKISKKLLSSDYIKTYNNNYKLDIIKHSYYTIKYILKKRGLIFFIKFLITRFKDFINMLRWLNKDTSGLRNNLEDKKLL